MTRRAWQAIVLALLTAPATGNGPVVGVRDLGWIVSVSGEVVYE